MGTTNRTQHLADIFRGVEALGLVVQTTQVRGVWAVAGRVRNLTTVDIGGAPWLAWASEYGAPEPICPLVDQYSAVERIGSAFDLGMKPQTIPQGPHNAENPYEHNER